MKNNLEPYLSWLLTQRPFAAPNRGGGSGDISKVQKVQSTSAIDTGSTAISTIIKSSSSSQSNWAVFTDSAPVQHTRPQSAVTAPNLSPSDKQHTLVPPSSVHFVGEGTGEDMARLRIEPTPKRSKLSSALQTPRGNISSSPETLAVKSTSKRNVPNPHGTYQPLHFNVTVWRSDGSVQIPRFLRIAHQLWQEV